MAFPKPASGCIFGILLGKKLSCQLILGDCAGVPGYSLEPQRYSSWPTPSGENMTITHLRQVRLAYHELVGTRCEFLVTSLDASLDFVLS